MGMTSVGATTALAMAAYGVLVVLVPDALPTMM